MTEGGGRWSEREVALLRLLTQRSQEEKWRQGKFLEEAQKVLPGRSEMAIKQKRDLMLKRHEI